MMGEQLQQYLTAMAENYDADLALLGSKWQGPGYHSLVPAGTWVHSTRGSLDYALALLVAGSAENVDRASAIIAKLLSLQDTNPTNATYGIWSWLYEEPLDQMSPPDWNWADFMGALLCHMCIEHADKLDAALLKAIKISLGHAGWSIFRRNVQPDYTNIAVMGAAVSGIAGEILGEDRLLDYGRQRLDKVLQFTRYNGGLSEYNSPTYTMIALYETERILQLAQDANLRESAEALRQIIWQTIADHYHPGTSQWAGPHSRAYSDYINAATAQAILVRTGVNIPLHPTAVGQDAGHFSPIEPLACPPELVEQFRRLPADPVFIQTSFTKAHTTANRAYHGVTGTTWMTADATLGTVNYDSLWTQRRPLIGYWCTEDDPAIVLRLRFLRDGKDFASAGVFNVQRDNFALSMIGFMANMGDFHLHLDQPDGGIFDVQDLRVRFEVIGAGVQAEQIADDIFALRAGGWQATVYAAPATFNGQPVTWEVGQDTDHAYVDAVLTAEQYALDLTQTQDFRLATGLELHPIDSTTRRALPVIQENDEMLTAQWETLAVSGSVDLWPHVYFSLRK